MRARIALVAAAAVVATAASIVEYGRTGALLEGGEAAVAGVLAVALVGYALTLPGLEWRGALLGGFFVGAGVLSWSYGETPIVVWGFLAVEGIAFAVLSYPWLRDLPGLARLGGAWLGLAYWLIGIVGALLAVNLKISTQRIAYAGVFTLAALAVVASARRVRPGRDLSVGVVAAFLVAIAALVAAGSGNLFDATHVVPDTGWGTNMAGRFWGGEHLLYHPNSLALIGVVAAIRIAPDPAFARWQRLVALALGGAVVYVTNSRSGFLLAGTAAAAHAALLWWRARHDRPLAGLDTYRRPWLAAAAPFLVLVSVLVLSGGEGFIFVKRYDDAGLTSGRAETWKQVFVDWRRDPVVDKVFGDTETARAVVKRKSSGDVQLTTDNAAIGALRRGGVAGVLAFLVGLYLLVRHALAGLRGGGSGPPAWFVLAVAGALPMIAFADWLLGGTGGTLWILLLTAEAVLVVSTVDAGRVTEPA